MLPFSTNIGVPRGSYIVRVAVMDSAGRTGSVDHKAEVIDARFGSMSARGPLFVRVPTGAASIAYLAEGDKSLPKERIEIFGGGKSFVIDDFRSSTSYQNGRKKTTKLREQDKGQREEIRASCAMILEGKPEPISLKDLATTTRATFRIKESLRTGLPIEV